MLIDYKYNSVENRSLNEKEENELINFPFEKNIKVFIINKLNEVKNKRLLLDAINKTCSFPGYFGFNWDALRDCINDFSFNESNGYLFIVYNSKDLKENLNKDFDIFFDIFQEACERWKEDKVFFKVVLA